MRRQLSILGLTVLMLALFDLSVALALRLGEGRIPGFAAMARFFEYGRSVPGKLDAWERTPGTSGNLFEVAWMDETIADSAAKFALESPGSGHVVRGYGMSFTNQMLRAAAEADPALRIDLHAGPGASPNFTYALFLDDAGSRRSGDVVVLGLLSSSLASLAALSNRTGSFEQPAPVTYPVFRPDSSRGLQRIDPLVTGLAEERSARSDTAVGAAWQRQLSLDDMLYTRAAFAAPVLDVSPLARLVRRALAVSAIDRRKEAVLDGGFPVEETLRRIVRLFDAQTKAEGTVPVVVLVQSNRPGDPDLQAVLQDTLDETRVRYLATANVASPRDPGGYLADGHFTEAVNARLATALLALLPK